MDSWPSVPRISAPSPEVFASDYLKRGVPVILHGVVEGWAATQKWAFAWLRESYGEVALSGYVSRQGRMIASTEIGLPVETITIATALQRLATNQDVHLSCWVEDLPPDLQTDITTPPYCEKVPWLRRRFWITSPGMVTETHQDPYDNLFGVLAGSKRFLLVPPRPRSALYPHSPFSRIPNFSRVDVEYPDTTRFPLFRRARPMVAEVHAGDLLYIPNLWWHHVRAIEPTLALNFFWSRGWMVPLTRLAAVYRHWRKI